MSKVVARQLRERVADSFAGHWIGATIGERLENGGECSADRIGLSIAVIEGR